MKILLVEDSRTTRNNQRKAIEAIKAGVDDYMVKPFIAETLAEKTAAALAKDGAAASG